MAGGRARKGGSNGGGTAESPARAKMSAPGEAQEVALVRVNTARKSFPAACDVHKKHRKRFFRGSTYGLYLSASRRKPRQRKAGSDESGTSMDGEAAVPEAGKENSCPAPSADTPADESASEGNSPNGPQPVAGTSGWGHDSSIASSVKNRQRVKRRLMDDHVDVDDVTICSPSSPPDGAANKKERASARKGANGSTSPLCEADLNCGNVDVVWDNASAGPNVRTLCCCLNPAQPSSETVTACLGMDCLQGKVVGCARSPSSQRLERPSEWVPFLPLCGVHHHRLRLHHCCPHCGLFCTQGRFMQCSKAHLWHIQCQKKSMPKKCPHCGRRDVRAVHLEALGCPLFQLAQQCTVAGPRARMSCAKSKPPGPAERSPNFDTVSLKEPSDGAATSPVLEDPSLCPTQKELDRVVRQLRQSATSNSNRPVLQGAAGTSTLLAACRQGDIDRVVHCLSGRELGAADSVAVHAAAQGGSMVLVHVLLQAGLPVDHQDDQLYTPLMRAVESGSLPLVQYFLKAGANPHSKGEDSKSCLHLAARCGNLELCQIFLNAKLPINSKDDGGWTPLVWASEHGRVDVVRLLLSRGADPNLRDTEKNTALHWSAYSGNVEISLMYLDRGCDPNARNVRGDTPLHIAARQDHYNVVVLLLNHKARYDALNEQDDTPVDCCKDEKALSYTLLNVNLYLGRLLKSKLPIERVLHRDISKGKEGHAISCVNGVDDEPAPSDFTYVLENCQTAEVPLDRSITAVQSCKCQDDCSSQNCVCSNISYRCWYNEEGLLVPDFNLVDPPMLFECSRACLCWNNCRNRVVQKGMTCHLQLFRTESKGWGVRTLQDIPRGTFVCEYVGEMVSDSEADKREDDAYLFDLENRDGETYCLDARRYGNVSRFVNHLCEPNLVTVRVFVDHQDLRFPRMTFFSSRDISRNEELGFDYGDKFWMIKYKCLTCECGSPKCKYSKERISETVLNYQRREEAQASAAH